MRIKGKKIEGPNVEIIVIPRKDEDIVFKAQAVLDLEDFEKLCPVPKPPQMLKRGVGMVDDVEDVNYKIAMRVHAERRIDWIVLQSLKATPDLEWETVDYGQPDTWRLYKKELRDSGFGEYEINRIINGVMIANSLDDRKMEEARERFLLGQRLEQEALSSQKEGKNSTPSGNHANVSVLGPQA